MPRARADELFDGLASDVEVETVALLSPGSDLPSTLPDLSWLPDGVGEAIAARHGGVAVSALARRGLPELIERAERTLFDATGGAPAAANVVGERRR